MASLSNVKTFRELTIFFQKGEEVLIQNLQQEHLIKVCGRCTRCGRNCTLGRSSQYKGNYASFCPTCKTFKSLLKGTYFSKRHLDFQQLFEVMYLWSNNISISQAVALTGISRKSIINCFASFREVASWKITRDQGNFQFGGPGRVVQIDEYFIAGREDNGEEIVPSKWVIGIYDTTLKTGVVMFLLRRDQENVLPVIRQFVLPGTEIWTDKWSGYNGLNQFKYLHRTVDDSKHFVDPVTGVCTNAVKQYWYRVKRFCLQKNVLRSKLLAEHVDEFMWRETYCKGAVAFQILLQHIREAYPM